MSAKRFRTSRGAIRGSSRQCWTLGIQWRCFTGYVLLPLLALVLVLVLLVLLRRLLIALQVWWLKRKLREEADQLQSEVMSANDWTVQVKNT